MYHFPRAICGNNSQVIENSPEKNFRNLKQFKGAKLPRTHRYYKNINFGNIKVIYLFKQKCFYAQINIPF